MIKEIMIVDESFPTVNVALNFIFNDEVQIHQGAADSEGLPELNSDMPRDVISMSREQALAVAKTIIKNFS